METYPVILDGKECGEVRVYRSGSRCVFECFAAMRKRLIRLSVYGGGREGYLGVLAPERGRLYIRRTLSQAAMRGFPENIEYASEAGNRQAEPKQEPPSGEEGGLLWFSSPSGVLTASDGEQNLTAVPAGKIQASGVERRTIAGAEYVVFKGLPRRK